MNTNPWPSMPTLKPAQTKLARLNGEGAIDNRSIPHNVEPPIARAEHIQQMIRGLRRDRDMYRKLLEDTEKLLADYEVMAGVCPF